MNQRCKQCQDAYQGINGRYCTIVKRYVEYDKVEPCKRTEVTARKQSTGAPA